jgi:transposase
MIKYSKLSGFKIKKIIKHFIVDLTATQTAEILWFNRKTINHYYSIFRKIIYANQIEKFKKVIWWEIEIDESYFWAKRIRWISCKLKRWRWTLKQPVFWIFKRNWEVYTEIIPNCRALTLRPIIQWKISPDTVIYSDWWKWYDGLVDVWYDKHFRVNHWNHEFSKWSWIHINWIENFWSFTKRRLNKFNWVKVNFHLHLKECEWRYWKINIELEKNLFIMVNKFFKF